MTGEDQPPSTTLTGRASSRRSVCAPRSMSPPLYRRLNPEGDDHEDAELVSDEVLRRGARGESVPGAGKPSEPRDDRSPWRRSIPTGVVVGVLSVSVDETQDKLRITWRYEATRSRFRLWAKKPVRATGGHSDHKYWKSGERPSGSLKEKSYRHAVLSTKDGDYDATDIQAKGIVVPAGAHTEVFAKFAKPDADTKKIHFQIRGGAVRDLTVTRTKTKD